MPRPAAIVLLVLLAGCEAPPAVAPTGMVSVTAPTHYAGAWQQFCEQALSVPQASALVAARGADGWELVAMYNGVLCYKRPAGPPPSRAAAPAPPTNGGPLVPVVRDPGF